MKTINELQQARREKLQDRLGVSLANIADVCRRYSIQELAVFGSILREDFKPESDIDFLVSLPPGFRVTLNYQESLAQELKKMINREIDLIFKQNLERSENWMRKKNIIGTAEVIYGS